MKFTFRFVQLSARFVMTQGSGSKNGGRGRINSVKGGFIAYIVEEGKHEGMKHRYESFLRKNRGRARERRLRVIEWVFLVGSSGEVWWLERLACNVSLAKVRQISPTRAIKNGSIANWKMCPLSCSRCSLETRQFLKFDMYVYLKWTV